MAALCLTRLFTRNSLIISRQIYICERTLVGAAAASANTTPLLSFNNRNRNLVRCSANGNARNWISYNVFSNVRHHSIKVDIKPDPPKKPSLLQRFKQMYRDYWYVLVPVHLVTSAGWFGGFYYLATSGVDIAGLLESWNVSERITNSLKDSSMGYLAVSYALYKLATPLRYTVTLGGTTISINYLKRWGYIKPVPSTNQLKEMYIERKENIMESIRRKKVLPKEASETNAADEISVEPLKEKNKIIIKHFDRRTRNEAKVDLSKPKEIIKITKKEQVEEIK